MLDPSSDPDHDGIVVQAHLTLVGKTAAKATVRLDLGADGSYEQKAKADKKGNFHFAVDVGPGVTPIRVQLVNASKRRPAAQVVVDYVPPVVDKQAPIISLRPLGPGAYSNHALTVSGRVVDGLSGVADLDAQVDSSAVFRVTFDADGNFQFPVVLPMDGTADGVHVLRLRAIDKANNTSIASPVTTSFTFDTRPPLVAGLSPATGTTVCSNVNFSGRVTDTLSPLAGLLAQVDFGGYMPVAVDPTGGFSLTTGLPLDGTADGVHSVRVVATDAAGNTSVPVESTFTLDTRAPTIIIASPASGQTVATNITVSGHVGDLGSGVQSLAAQVDAGQSVNVAFDPATGAFAYTTALSLDGTADGVHTVHLRATDKVGITSSADLPFTLKATQADDELLQLDFEGNPDGAAGEIPLAIANSSYQAGEVGQGLHTGNSGYVQYAVANNIQSSSGTIGILVPTGLER